MTNFPKIYVAGHRGMVGSAIVRQLLAQGQPAERIISRTHAELDLCNQAEVNAFIEQEKPDQVYMAAAKVGGIHANNTYPAKFICDSRMCLQMGLMPLPRLLASSFVKVTTVNMARARVSTSAVSCRSTCALETRSCKP